MRFYFQHSSGISEFFKCKTIFSVSIWKSIEFLLLFYTLSRESGVREFYRKKGKFFSAYTHVAAHAVVYCTLSEIKIVKWRISRALTRKIEFKWTFIELNWMDGRGRMSGWMNVNNKRMGYRGKYLYREEG